MQPESEVSWGRLMEDVLEQFDALFSPFPFPFASSPQQRAQHIFFMNHLNQTLSSSLLLNSLLADACCWMKKSEGEDKRMTKRISERHTEASEEKKGNRKEGKKKEKKTFQA